tara:strand:- start:1454 stop:1750 length:297 start_codon:yes stop_codon:yes gene_type:complete
MNNNEVTLSNFFVNDNEKSWIDFDLVFDAKELAQTLLTHKKVFESNKGRGRISIKQSKKDPNKRYATLSTWINPKYTEPVSTHEHMPDRQESKDDLPF